MTTTTEKLIPLGEALNRVSVYWLDKVGAKVEEDWSGQPVVRGADAAKALKLQQAAEEQQADRERQHRAHLATREAQRREVYRSAYRAAEPEILRREVAGAQERFTYLGGTLGISPAGSAIAGAIAREAVAKFDAKNPEKSVEDFR